MATQNVVITINTPDNITPAQVVSALCDYWGYQDTVNGQPNPQTKAQFVKGRIALFVKESYKAARAQQDSETARQAALVSADTVGVD